MTKIILGIDVSKKTLDAALIFDKRTFSKQFKNSAEGFKSLTAWLESLEIEQVHACLEATGTYSEAAARVFARARASGVGSQSALESKVTRTPICGAIKPTGWMLN